jgi:hypothetical protein
MRRNGKSRGEMAMNGGGMARAKVFDGQAICTRKHSVIAYRANLHRQLSRGTQNEDAGLC